MPAHDNYCSSNIYYVLYNIAVKSFKKKNHFLQSIYYLIVKISVQLYDAITKNLLWSEVENLFPLYEALIKTQCTHVVKS